MASTMHLDVVSAEEEIFSGEVEFVVARATEGELGIMPRHAPLLARLQPGEVRVRLSGDEEQYFYVSGGMIEVQPKVVTILADTAARAKDLDEAAAEEAKKRAEEAIRNRTGEMDYARAQTELAAAAAQLRAIQSLRKKRGKK
ncbi:F-type H+-transporting ATPase subunit epsilon [Natronocella acetinitrilica]|jgi:F-type H+-transporting ATPase subunit epsilon|uniref:ATP synthase epsilon chain n=1 Tax=Natronocella acetinitrilica TaxID=414046 RepID=A0AAE3G1C4_9GAMM|nr:F0F1 ATP synthase subunit epsilon [Natronocella acetinitrilica]MCP1673388.1 F-type H+-transporting ATPase subunit epsilon [Natronocella acetinitrilica]